MNNTVKGMKHIFNRFLVIWVISMVLTVPIFSLLNNRASDMVLSSVLILAFFGVPVFYLPTALFIIPLLNRQWKTAGSRLVVLAVLIVVGIALATVAIVAIPIFIMIIVAYIITIGGSVMNAASPALGLERDPDTTSRMYEDAKREYLNKGGN